MKKISKILFLITILLGLSGCLKYEVNMKISDDKSMDFVLIEATSFDVGNDDEESDLEESNNSNSDSLLEDDDLLEGIDDLGDIGQDNDTDVRFNTSDYEKFEKAGYKIEEYEEKKDDEKYVGVKISKKYSNIDDLSTNKDEAIEFTTLFDGDSDPENVHFFYKNGNKYKANLTFNLVDEDSDDTTDYSQFEDYFDLEYKVTLPEKSISNNATSVSEDGKTLTWKMKYGEKNSIQYEFEMPNNNSTLIYIISGTVCAIGVIAIVSVIIIINKKKKNRPISNGTTNL